MKPVVVRLKEYKRFASESEKEVVGYILKDPEAVVKMSIHQLGKETFTSASTIIRLCRKVDFKGFKELKKELIVELALKEYTTIPEQKEIRKEDTTRDIIDKMIYKHIISLEDTKSLIDTATLEACVKLMGACQNIHLFGIGSSLLVAKDAQQKFMRINKPCFAHEDTHVQLLQAKNVTAQDLVIIFSYSGETKEMIQCGQLVKENGAKIISITRFGSSKVAELADYNMYVASNEPIKRSGAMTSRMSQLCIVDILYIAYVQTTYDEAFKTILKTQIEKE